MPEKQIGLVILLRVSSLQRKTNEETSIRRREVSTLKGLVQIGVGVLPGCLETAISFFKLLGWNTADWEVTPPNTAVLIPGYSDNDKQTSIICYEAPGPCPPTLYGHIVLAVPNAETATQTIEDWVGTYQLAHVQIQYRQTREATITAPEVFNCRIYLQSSRPIWAKRADDWQKLMPVIAAHWQGDQSLVIILSGTEFRRLQEVGVDFLPAEILPAVRLIKACNVTLNGVPSVHPAFRLGRRSVVQAQVAMLG